MKPASFNSTSDTIDSRDILDRIADLEEERDQEADRGYLREWLESEEGEELAALLALNEEANGVSDWDTGTTLINYSYFEEYAQQLAEELGLLEKANQWPLTCIDWELAARELKYDYIALDYAGTTFYVFGG